MGRVTRIMLYYVETVMYYSLGGLFYPSKLSPYVRAIFF